MTQTASDAQPEQQILVPATEDDNPPQSNGHHEENGGDGEPPSKRRRVSEATPVTKPKAVSPPWKKIVAEGPSSFTQDGKRKSGRTNHIPFELQPPSDKRQTRGAQKEYSSKGKGQTNGHSSAFHAKDAPAAIPNGTKKHVSSGTPTAQHLPKSPAKVASPKRLHRKSMPSQQVTTPVRSHHKKPSEPKNPSSAPAHSRTGPGRRAGRAIEILDDEEPSRPQALKADEQAVPSPRSVLSRIKFRVKAASLPITNPGLVVQRPKQYPTLREFFLQGANIPVEDGGLYHPDEPNEYTADVIARDTDTILRAEEAVNPGGILSPESCVVYQPEITDQAPPQYAHADHMIRAALEFRKLMLIERRKHREMARRAAVACQAEWNRRRPKTREDLEKEDFEKRKTYARSMMSRPLEVMFMNVQAEVNRRRLLEWEAQEQARIRKTLSEAVDVSMLKVEAHMDTNLASDEEATDESDGSDGESGSKDGSTDEDRDSNMSSSDSEAEEEQPKLDVAEDEQLTVEQLRDKYAAMPTVDIEPVDEEMIDPDDEGDINQDANVEADDSDESVDMDDDMGSSDEEQDSEEEDDLATDEDEDEEDAGESTLLGFLPSSELKDVKLGNVEPEPEASGVEEIVDSEDEVSLVPNGTDAHASAAISEATEHESAAFEKDLVEPAMGLSNGLHEIDASTIDDSVPQKHVRLDMVATSPDHSSQPTPRTTETRPSDIDSASSVELHHSRQATQSSTPQPNNNLRTPIPFLLRGTLRDYQHHGLDWLAKLYANNTNGILADEMGLGKTIQTIALLAHLACEHQVWGPHLVVVPTSVILNWEMEFKKWCPGFKILTYYGSIEERKRKRLGWNSEDAWNICITSYQLVIQDQNVFKRRRWHYMILDEAHNIKNFNSARWQTMLGFNTRARLLITGTPLQNNLTELWSLLFFLMPSDGTSQGLGGFANLKEFQSWFDKPSQVILGHGREHMDDDAKDIITKLHTLLRPYLLRRLKADVEKQMPAKYEHVEYCRLSKRQRELYDGFLSRGDTRDTLAGGNYLSIINCLMQLRKVCNHPDLFVERAIMTSFPMEKSAVADFEIKDLIVRRRLLREDPMTKASLEFLNLVPTKHERLSGAVTSRSSTLSAQRTLMEMREAQRARAQNAYTSLDPSTAKSNMTYLESASRWGRFEELQHCVYLNALRRQQKPLYGTQVLNLLTLGISSRPLKARPHQRSQMLTWLENRSPALMSMVPSLEVRSETLKSTIQRVACVTPPVVAKDINSVMLSPKGLSTIQSSVTSSKVDPFHEARMRLSIQFPDKRLLQYDCGKLQTLAKLLRKLEAGGHRALIFTQMTKVLDILEQFLNIHGHKYLRLDGQTKVEQRQVLTDRFNNDTRILAFILSTRSGGLGINLTGADTVIFYDLDWNPAMDKQCQDRCHRIGQTRDVHIYRLVSEHTIEANILRKANQKQMLDDVVIQEGEFTTDYFNKPAAGNVVDDEHLQDGDAAASAAMDRLLGGPGNAGNVQRVLAQAEDQEDVAAAQVAEREDQADAADFKENEEPATATGTGTPREGVPTPAGEGTPAADKVTAVDVEDELNAWGKPIQPIDEYLIRLVMDQVKDTPLELPKDKNKSKRGRDHRSHRAR